MKWLQHRISALLFCSGFSALIYEIVWAKQLTLMLGSSISAISIVTATFMGGLALGSWLFGRVADHASNPLKLYALLEGAIFFAALTFPWVLDLTENLYIGLHQQWPASPAITSLARLALAALMLLPPTVCMGGTLPSIARFHERTELSKTLGRMYAFNTLGGVLGCFIAGFVLLPSFGTLGTTHLALVVNLLVCIIAWGLARSARTHLEQSGPPASELEQQSPPLHRALPFIAFSGCFALSMEILWTRLLVLQLGNTSYAFSSILCVYLLGLALGGFVYNQLRNRNFAPRAIYFWGLVTATLFILVSHSFYDQLAHLFQFAHQMANENWWLLSQYNLVAITLTLMLPTIAFGITLPAGIALIAPRTDGSSNATGMALVSNTGGAVIGSLLAAFALLPNLGLHGSIHAALVAALLVSFVFLVIMRPFRVRLSLHAVMALLVVAGFYPVHWDHALMNSGIYVYSDYYEHQGGLREGLSNFELLDVIEGKETTVAVLQDEQGIKTFRVNGKTDGSNGPDMLNQVLSGQLPMLLHPDPENALVVGLGTGITLGEIMSHPIVHADCIEISPEVIEAARHFSEANRQVLDNPRATISVNDGRNFLLVTENLYDVIVSVPSNPWQSGNANLFTSEYYQLVREHLKPGGIFSQWLPLYDLNQNQLSSAFHTFAEQFSDIRVFRIGPEMIVLGSQEPIPFDTELIASRLDHGNIGSSLERFGVLTPSDLMRRYYFANGKLLHAFGEEQPQNSDQRPTLEYAKVMGTDHSRDNIAALMDLRREMGTTALD